MIPTHKVHKEWHPLLVNLHLDKLKRLQQEELAHQHHYPRGERILYSLFYPISRYKCIILRKRVSNPMYESVMDRMQRYIDDNHGVLHLPCAFTSGLIPEDHDEAWREWTQRMVAYISKVNPCIWIFEKGTTKYIPYISNPLMVKDYDKETIKHMPTHPNTNYIITPSDDKEFYFHKFFNKN